MDRQEVPLDTVTQIICQEACLNGGDSCVGVSCSSHSCNDECYLCSSQGIIDVATGDVFIKRPGNFPFNLWKLTAETWINCFTTHCITTFSFLWQTFVKMIGNVPSKNPFATPMDFVVVTNKLT